MIEANDKTVDDLAVCMKKNECSYELYRVNTVIIRSVLQRN